MRTIAAALICIALVGCGSRPIAEWLDELKEKESSRRVRAVRALGERGAEAERAIPALAQALKDEDAFVRREAARSLGQMGDSAASAAPALTAAMRDKNAQVRKAASEAIRRIVPDSEKR